MNPLYLDLLTSVGRSALKIAGTSIVAHGFITADNWSFYSGLVITVIGVVASGIQAHQASVAASAPATPPNSTTGGLL